MKRYEFTLTGLTPLLMHADDVLAADDVQAWRKDPMNKNSSVPGDDRSPSWTWKSYLYTDGKSVTMPADNVMVALRMAGAEVPMSGRKTFKAATQTGLLIEQEHMPLEIPAGVVSVDDINAIPDDAPFEEHMQAAKRLGFELFVKRTKVGQAKHVRIRPRFDEWRFSGSLAVSGPEFTTEKLKMLFDIAGMTKGLGDWRPSAPKSPGPFGRFKADVQEIAAERREAA